MLLVTIGGVYATWTYTQTTDVADEAVNKSLNLTGVTYSGSYGTYTVDMDSLTLKIDPEPGTTHTTSLVVDGQIVVTFTPSNLAPVEIKNNGVESTFSFSLTNNNWTYDGRAVVTLNHPEAHPIQWTPASNGTFTFTLPAAKVAEHISLGEFVLDTKAKYDDFNTKALGSGQIVFTVSDGITSATPTT